MENMVEFIILLQQKLAYAADSCIKHYQCTKECLDEVPAVYNRKRQAKNQGNLPMQ